MLKIETERLLLKEFNPDEAAFYYQLNLDEEVMRYTGDVAFESIEKTRSFLEKYDAYKRSGYGRWSVYLKDGHTLMGWCGIKYHVEKEYTDLGYRINKLFWNKGYATEASIASLNFGFQNAGLSIVYGLANKENIPSLKVLQKVGMKPAEPPELREDCNVYYAMDRTTWLSLYNPKPQ